MNMNTSNSPLVDGVHAPVPRDRMSPGARKLRDAYECKPGAPLVHREFYIWGEAVERWKAEEGMPADVPPAQLFGYDPPGKQGWINWAGVRQSSGPVLRPN